MPDQYPLTAEAVTAIVGIAFFFISILLSKAPKLSKAWAALDGDYKRAIMLGLYLTASLSVMAFRCGMVQACLQSDLWLAVNVGLSAFAASQGAFVMFGRKAEAPKPSGE